MNAATRLPVRPATLIRYRQASCHAPGSSQRGRARPRALIVLDRGTAAPRWLEHGGPVLVDADHGPAVGAGQLEGLLGAAGVVELALGVVVQHQQPQPRPGRAAGELEHW